MNSTTGAEPTALSIAALVSVDRKRILEEMEMGEMRVEANWDGRDACLKAWEFVNCVRGGSEGCRY